MEKVRGLSVSVSGRDFEPGRSLADNIVSLLHRSAHVITVVSRDYSKSAWCRYQVQVALTDMHERRRNNFLIPIPVLSIP